MSRLLAILLLQAFLLVRLPFATAEEKADPTLRALIVTCDQFVSQEDTTPAAQENARLMAEMLARDARGYAAVRTECDTIGSVDAFAGAVEQAFAGADGDDISLIYISTHGLYNPSRSNLTAELLLSTRDWISMEETSSSADPGAIAAVTREEDSWERRPTPNTSSGTSAIRSRKRGCFRILLFNSSIQSKSRRIFLIFRLAFRLPCFSEAGRNQSETGVPRAAPTKDS